MREAGRVSWALVKGAVLALVAAAVATALLQVFRGDVAFGGAFALAALVQLALRALPRLAPAPDPGPAARPGPPATTVLVDLAASTIGQSLSSPVHLDRVLRPRLVRLTDERLRRHHGLDRAHRPEQTRAIVGDDLWSFLQHPATPVDAAHLAALMTRIEAL